MQADKDCKIVEPTSLQADILPNVILVNAASSTNSHPTRFLQSSSHIVNTGFRLQYTICKDAHGLLYIASMQQGNAVGKQ